MIVEYSFTAAGNQECNMVFFLLCHFCITYCLQINPLYTLPPCLFIWLQRRAVMQHISPQPPYSIMYYPIKHNHYLLLPHVLDLSSCVCSEENRKEFAADIVTAREDVRNELKKDLNKLQLANVCVCVCMCVCVYVCVGVCVCVCVCIDLKITLMNSIQLT
jgi:hypothetical protein